MKMKFRIGEVYCRELCYRVVEKFKYAQHSIVAFFSDLRKAEQASPVIIFVGADVSKEFQIINFKFQLLKQLSSTRDMHRDLVRRGYRRARYSDNAVDRICFNGTLTGLHRNEVELHPQVVQCAAQHYGVGSDLILPHLAVPTVFNPCDVADRDHRYDGRTSLSYGCGRGDPRRRLVCRQVGGRPSTPSESGCRSGNGPDRGHGNVRHEVRHALDHAAILETRQGGPA